MHDHAPSEAAPPLPVNDSNEHHHHHHYHHGPRTPSPPDYPPPSYDDATRSETAPLLAGPPPNYGAFRAYVDPDESSIASSEVESADRSLPEWVGQALVVFLFVSIMYGFWKVINAPDSLDSFPGGD
ncbi:hypothetical protein BKA63DRAFT_560533 [Paraphoma chrysanthemicola]|nr:hypothetical protein BKA63DRAFT_560533 [Paraphoma chrysanthemicola]